MSPIIVLQLFSLFALPMSAPVCPETGTKEAGCLQDDDPKELYEKKRDEAGRDPAKLWEVHLWCEAYGLEKEAKSCARAVVKYDEDHKEAHLYLNHIFYEGKWFTSERKLKKHKEDEAERIAKEKGWVKHGDTWVAPEDLPFVKRGLVKDDSGNWVDKETLEKTLAGWIRHDAEWVHPD